MFVQSKLAEKRARPNRKVAGKTILKNGSRSGNEIRTKTGPGGNGSNGTYTGGYTPRYGTRQKPKKKLSAITPWKVILTGFLIGICGILYISHVFSTQRSLQELQRLEAEYTRVKRIHAGHRLAYDRMVGPKEIYRLAREQGFVNGGPADQVLILN